MPRVCTVCRHPDRATIDAELVARPESLRDIAGRFTISKSALHRHREHISDKLTKAKDAADATEADGLLSKLASAEARITRALDQAEQTKDYRAVFAGARELRECVRLLAELRGKLATAGTVNVAIGMQSAPEPTRAELEAMVRVLAHDELGATMLRILADEQGLELVPKSSIVTLAPIPASVTPEERTDRT